MRRRVVSIRRIFSGATLALVTIAVVLVGGVAERSARTQLALEVEGRLLLEARNLALLSADALLTEFPELALAPLLNNMQRERDDLSFVTVVDHQGTIQGHRNARMLGTSFTLPKGLGPVAPRMTLEPGEEVLSGAGLLVARVPAVHEGQHLGAAIVGMKQDYIDTLVARARRPMLVVIGLLVAGGIAATIGLVSLLLRPIGYLRAGLERIGRGDLDTPMALGDRTELGLLADTVDQMAGQLKASREESLAKEAEIIETQKEVIVTLGDIVESRSRETADHIVRVGKCSRLLSRLAGLDEKEAELVHLAAPMHDVGKVAIPDSLLNKPGRLTADERKVIETHAEIGYGLLRNSNRPILRAAAVIAHEHHEKWDGSGYPRGISGEDIHIYGRIVGLVDVFDALRSERAYKKAMSRREILDILEEERGRHFDPRLTDLFVRHIDTFIRIHTEHSKGHKGTTPDPVDLAA